MREQTIQSDMIKHIRGLGGYAVKVSVGSGSGIPDILCCIDGRFIGIEVKRPEKRDNASPLQLKHIDWIIDAGGLAGVAWDIKSLEEILNADNG